MLFKKNNNQNTYNKRTKNTIKKFLPINFEIKTVLKATTAKKKNSSNDDQRCETQKDYIVEHVMKKKKGSKNGLLYWKISYQNTQKNKFQLDFCASKVKVVTKRH